MGDRSAVRIASGKSPSGASRLGGADLQRLRSPAQSGQPLLDAAPARLTEIKSPGHRGLRRIAVDRSHPSRLLPLLVIRPLHSLPAAHEITAGFRTKKWNSLPLGERSRNYPKGDR